MQLERQSDALLVVDVQPDFMPGGPLAVAGGDEIVAPIGQLMQRFETVVATQDWHTPGHISFASTHGRAPLSTLPLYGQSQVLWPDHCVQGTAGADLHAELPTTPISLILRKGSHPEVDSYSALRENYGPDGERATTGLAAWLSARGIRRLFLCGLARDYCVLWSAQDAADAGFEVVLLDDLTRAVDPSARQQTDAAYAKAGVAVISSEAL